MSNHVRIVATARKAHSEHRPARPHGGLGKRRHIGNAQTRGVVKTWQEAVCDGSSIIQECLVNSPSGSPHIDVVDMKPLTAYEMKVSGSNPMHEFPKDVFKIHLYNSSHPDAPLKKMVFLTEAEGVAKLKGNIIATHIIYVAKTLLGFEIELIPIP